MTSRSQAQSQGHEGRFRFYLAVFTRFRILKIIKKNYDSFL